MSVRIPQALRDDSLDDPSTDLYRWQLDALIDWLRCGRRGVIEAVTGSGKTDVALAAAADARRRGLFVLILVPSRVLMEQWFVRLERALPHDRIGRLGDSHRDTSETCDVLVSTRHSAASHRPLPPDGGDGLLIADECHGLGGVILRKALSTKYHERLGLTATLERSDDAVTEVLLPYFGGICHRYGFDRAIMDGVCARPRVAFVGVSLSAEERADYVATEQQLVDSRRRLRAVPGIALEPFGAFLAAVGHLAERDAGPDGRAAREYLDSFSRRRHIVAQSSGKYELLGKFAPAAREAHGALLFTETVRAANHAINHLDPLIAIELITGSTPRAQRRTILDRLRDGTLDAVAAPRVLDEGIDVPDADLGIVMSASRTRRQMIQRMGRILRRKPPGIGARFVIMYAKDTLEDPSNRIDRDGFIEEIETICESSGVFDADRFGELNDFLNQPGPPVVVEPARADLVVQEILSLLTNDLLPGDSSTLDRRIDELATLVGPEAAYGYGAFTAPEHATGPHQRIVDRLAPRIPDPVADGAPYQELEGEVLPEVTTPKVEPRRLSTGTVALEMVTVDGGFQMRCTGCGAASPAVRFRWQTHEQTVPCVCGE